MVSERTWVLERQERGAFADMGQEHMGISAGGVAYQRSFSRGVSPSHSFQPLPSYVYVCVHIYLMELLGTWQDHTRQGG